MSHHLKLIATLAVLGFAPAVVHAQNSACLPADSKSADMVTWLTNIVTGTDTASVQMRAQLKLPQVAASQVSYVTTNSVCSKVVSTYNANSGVTQGGVPVSPSGKLYVVKVGTVYVANDPVKTWGEFSIYVTVDSKYKLLASSLG